MSKSSNETVHFDAVLDVEVFQDDNYCSVTISGGDSNWKATGTSRREPSDVPNVDIGFQLAMGRALENASRKFLKRSAGLVKHADDVKAAKEAAKTRVWDPRNIERLLHFLDTIDGYVGFDEGPAVVSHGMLQGPDFDDPNDPWLQPLGADGADAEKLYFHLRFMPVEPEAF